MSELNATKVEIGRFKYCQCKLHKKKKKSVLASELELLLK